MLKTDSSKAKGSTAKDFVKMWAANYGIKTGHTYKINWVRECAVLRKLMGTYSNLQLRSIIEFAFSGVPATAYIASQGYSIALLPSQMNRWNILLFKPEQSIAETELRLDQPVWDDNRTSFIYNAVMSSKPNRLISYIKNDSLWHILFAKMEKQNGYVPEKFRTYYKIWQDKVPITRTPKVS
jgi:hypothetical protein